MKFLVDRCAGLTTALWPNQQGHDELPAHTLPPNTPDSELPCLAASTGRILITSDKDFGRLVHHQLLPHAGLVNLPSTNAQRKLTLIEHALNSHPENIANGDTITISLHAHVRVTTPPTPPTRLQAQP